MSDVVDRLDRLSPERQALLHEILRRKVAREQEEDAIRPRREGGPAPLSFAQQRLWLLDRLAPGSSFYNVPFALRLSGAVDVAALERALAEIVRRHESLRTTFAEAGGGPVQVVGPAAFALPVEDLSSLPEGEREAAAQHRAGEDAARPFDLAAGPLFRAALLRLDAEEHVLLLCMHHIVGDGWSVGVLFRELRALYAAFLEGGESPLPDLPVQYADYAAWQRERLQGETLERELAYWRERLSGAPALLELPTDHPRPPVQTHRGADVPVRVSAEVSERLRELGRREDATPFMVLLAAFQVLLARYSGSEDVVVGSPIAGRTRAEVEGLVGFFVNTLVLRTDLSGDPTFRTLLARVREGTLGAYEHQQVPFEKLVAELQPERSLSHAPLFQVAFSLQNTDGQGGGLPGVRVRSADAETGTAKFDLSLALAETPRGVGGSLEYSTDLFERATVERMVEHLVRVLEQVAADADVRLSELELLSDGERGRVVEEWNRTARPYPRGVCIHDLFATQLRARPGAEALVWGGLRLTYAELDARANRLANHLVGLGVGPDERVGVLQERGPELIVSILAILKAGGCYVPLDPTYPAGRLELMLADAGVGVLLGERALLAALEAPGVHAVALDDAADALARESSEAPRSAASPENLAYIVYTSGSTGRPKGVMVAHRHVVQLVVETDYVRLGPGDRVAQASNASFDALTFEAWGALLNGATLVGVPRDVLLSTPALREFLREEGITTLYQTTALLNQHTREQPDVFAPLREVLFGGEASDADRVRALLRSGKPQRLVHVYGPTETTAWCSWEDVRHVAAGAPTVSVGRPTGNQRIYLLDAALRPTPVGVPGEAYVGGDGVVRGYLDRPGLTAERFLPDPFSGEPGARMYRTGDRLRWRAVRGPVGEDGAGPFSLEFVGRLDEQVKIRGFRIEPGEVESALSAHPEVREARVIVREDEPGEKRLVAYVVGQADAEALRSHLRSTLPEYMMPAAIVALERLPLTPNGKLDVKALPAPDLESDAQRYLAPRNPLEEVLAEVWAEVLRVERVGVHDGFFELGGHSLLATRVVSRVCEVLGVELPLRAMFEGPTVAELALRVEALRRAGAPQLPPVVPVGRDRPLPLSFAQERLWFLDRMEPNRPFYNIPAALRISGALDAGAMERSLGEIVRRHEALRTTFAEVRGSAVQVIAPFTGFTLPVEDLSALPEGEREALARRRAEEEAARPFDLTAGPLFRAALLRLGAEEHVLLVSTHHVVSDGWSMRVLFRELSALYRAHESGEEGALPALPVQYADFAAWQRETLHGARLEGELAWWKERLAGAPALLELPTDHPRPSVQTHRGAFEPLHLPPALAGRLRALARREGATMYMVLLGAFKILLSRYAGTEDVVVGTTIAGRTRAEVEPLIGLFMNTLVLRTDLAGDPDFREVLRRVREVAVGAYEHQEVPFERLVGELRPERSMSHEALFQVLFELHESKEGGGEAAGLGVRGMDLETGVARVDLSLILSARGGRVEGGATYSTDLFERGTVVRMLAQLRRVLEQVAAHPDRRLSRLELMSRTDRGRVLEWNRTTAAFPADRCIHQLFEAQAARTPDAPAVVCGGSSLSYREVDARANRLAHHLAGLGVGPEVRVGLCLERGPELIPAILGVMKAGGAWVPVDPSHPAERIGYVLEDAGVAVLLTQERLRAGVPLPAGVPVVCVDADAAWAAAGPAHARATGVTAENLAYVIYTSGSTGRPKGVAMHHRGVCNYIDWGIGFYGSDRGNGSPVFSSMAVDLTITNLLPLFAGGPVHLLPEENAVEALADALRQKPGFGAIKITPVHLSLLTPLLSEEEARAAGHTLVIGADFLSAETTLFWQDHAPGVRLMNEYGPTETVVGCSAYVLPPGKHRAGPVPVGHPIQNLRFYVLDEHLEPVPVGLPGELFIGGAGVARGYLGRPGLSGERFVPDPYAGQAGARMYRTGDRARWLADGNLVILGRTDDQVKIRGYRVELGEIEAVLRRHPGIRACRVVVRDDVPGGRGLVAYAVGDAATDELREHLRRALPEYMVPAAFVRLDELPRTTTGKIDPRTLPAPDFSAGSADFVAPRTPVEELLASLWCEVLEVERVGASDTFFDLGGHSLLALRIISRVRETLGVSLPLRALFEGPTLAELAGRVEALRRAEPLRLPPVAPVDRAGPLPLSFAQERLWFLDRLEPGSTVYNVSVGLRLGGALDRDALERAVGEVVRRHDVLRTVFRDADGSPVQVVAPFHGFVLPLEDLTVLPPAERRKAAQRRAEEEAARPFDLAAGPLFRATLLRLDAEQHLLLAAMHHTVTDGWSTGVFLRELSALYDAYAEGRESPLPDLPVQYADFAAWQREQLRGEALERELAWWRERLAGAPALLELPTDHPRPPVQSFRGASEEVAFPAETLDALRALARAEGVTLYMLLLAAFQVLLGKYAASTDVVVGGASAGRGRGDVEGLIGLFANTLALRTDLSGDPQFREVLARVRETTLGAWEHQDIPFERLVAELRPERSLGHSPLFQASFVLDDAAPAPAALPGLRGERVGTEVRTTKFDLTLGLAAGPRGLRGEIGYASDLFERDTIRRMRGHLARVLEQVVADPARRLSALELMTPEEHRAVVEEWGGRDGGWPPVPAHRLVAEAAARAPDAPALSCGGRVLSYRELDAASNRLAHHLAGRGVGPESLVALVAEGTPDTVVAILAAMKAGAAYLPLDPEYPEERLRYMLADAGACLLVTPGALPPALSGAGLPAVLDLRAEAATIAARPDRAPDVEVDPAGLAYVIYTSGSTGRPKGVAVAHNGISTQAWWMHSRCGLRAGDRVLQFASLSFDAAVNEVFPALAAGATLVLAPREALAPGDALRDTVRREGVTFVTFPPSVLAVTDPSEHPSLRVVVSAGEALSRGVADAWARAVELHNAYGPTEATVAASSGRVAPGGGRPTIGRPLENARAYVLDGAGRPVPARVPGELYLGGAGVARGYLRRPALTAERFVPDPFGGRPGARLYRTGDRARWRTDGELESLGRLDAQVKVRGFRIEPGEVEAVLRRHPGVEDCAVVAREDVPGDARLVAYVVGTADAEEVRAHLRAHLPAFMVPGPVVAVDAIPLSPNGKVDRRALPAPPGVAPGSRRRAAETELEARVAAVWAEVLGLEEVGVEDNFFDLGGHSLLLVRLQARLAAAVGADVRVVELFQYPTVRALSARLAGGAGTGAGAVAVDEAGERGGTRQAALDRRVEARRRRGAQGS